MNMEPGARSAALGSATMAVDGDYLGLVSNPYQLANVRYLWANFSHTAYFEDTQYDYASVAIPLGLDQGLGISFARFGADDIPYIREGDPLPEGSDYETLSIADWMLSATWGKRLFGRFELGVGFHLLYRDMDQSGFGFRGDAGLRYRILDDLYVAGLLKGWTSSASVWGSGEFEYSAPDLYLAASYGLDVRYLYGKFGFYWQSAGVFRHEPRDLGFETDESRGKPLWKDPLDWLSGGHAGIEFNFDFGLSLRAGLSSFTTFESFTAGAGLVIAKFLRVDYAFESHPVLSPVHRVSVSISPYLFSHAPKPEPERPAAAAPTSLLGAEPEEPEVQAVDGPAPQENAPAVPVVEENASGAQESSDEVLETRPSGGIQWEE
ncbi:hypothetical protein B7994_10245 [Fibrobacter sp. UWR2]|nr:hypothetical protein B7994_10245 [Fibrobacter sp. UWR2]